MAIGGGQTAPSLSPCRSPAPPGARNFGEALWFWLFALCIQIGTNLHNDYADFVKGADTHERLGQARATQQVIGQ